MIKLCKKTISLLSILIIIMPIFMPSVTNAFSIKNSGSSGNGNGGFIYNDDQDTMPDLNNPQKDSNKNNENTIKSIEDFRYKIPAEKKEYIDKYKIKDKEKPQDAIKYTIFYSDDYFSQSSTEFNEHLATLTMYMTKFSMNDDTPKNSNDTDWYDKQSIRLKGFFDTIGFENFKANEDYHKRTEFDTIGIGAASRKIGDYTVIAIVPRSGGYFREWSNNVWLGDGSKSDYMHEGWYNAANKLIDFLNQYIEDNNITGNIKLWMGGYSRGGATTNIAAGLLDNYLQNPNNPFKVVDTKQKVVFKKGSISPEVVTENVEGIKLSNKVALTHDNLYAYTLEAPQGANVYSKKVKMPNDAIYNNIFNIINPNDLVPKVAMSGFGFTRFGIDKYITTKFFDPLNFADNRTTFKMLYAEFQDVDKYQGDTLIMYGIPAEYIPLLVTPIGATITGTHAAITGDLWFIEEDKRKVNYDSNIVSTLFVDELTSAVGSREEYCKTYQDAISKALLIAMNDDSKVSEEDISDLIDAMIVEAISESTGKVGELTTALYDYFSENNNSNLGKELVQTMVGLLEKVYAEKPNEVLSIALGITGIFQNHEPDVTLGHMMSQDNYYTENYLAENNVNMLNSYTLVVPLRDNADMIHASFFGFNDLAVWDTEKTDVNSIMNKIKSGDILSTSYIVNVAGHTLGRSDVTHCEPGCAVGYYSYVTEEKMELFLPINHKYKLSMKCYSKKPIDHRIEYTAYYRYAKVNDLTQMNLIEMNSISIPHRVATLDSYYAKVAGSSDYIIRDLLNTEYRNSFNNSLGTAFGEGNIYIIIGAVVLLAGTTISSFIYVKKKKSKNKEK